MAAPTKERELLDHDFMESSYDNTYWFRRHAIYVNPDTMCVYRYEPIKFIPISGPVETIEELIKLHYVLVRIHG